MSSVTTRRSRKAKFKIPNSRGPSGSGSFDAKSLRAAKKFANSSTEGTASPAPMDCRCRACPATYQSLRPREASASSPLTVSAADRPVIRTSFRRDLSPEIMATHA